MKPVHVSAADPPKLSILVAAWNEAANIEPFIRSYRTLCYPNRELIICAGGSDSTFEQVQALADESMVVLPQEPGEGKQRALRKTLRHASGDVVVLTDADCVLNEHALLELVSPILAGDSEVTTGVSAPKAAQLSHPFVFYQHAVSSRWNTVMRRRRNLQALLGRNCAVSRAVLDEVGGFDEDVPIGTDSFLAKKILARGHEIRFVPDSVVETEFSTSLADYCRQRARWRRNAITHNLRFHQYGRALRAIRGALRGIAILALPLASIRFGRKFIYAWFAIVAWACVVRARYIRSTRQQGLSPPASIYVMLVPYLFTEWSAQALGLLQMLSPRARRRW